MRACLSTSQHLPAVYQSSLRTHWVAQAVHITLTVYPGIIVLDILKSSARLILSTTCEIFLFIFLVRKLTFGVLKAPCSVPLRAPFHCAGADPAF